MKEDMYIGTCVCLLIYTKVIIFSEYLILYYVAPLWHISKFLDIVIL